MPGFQPSNESDEFTERGIPIRNLWHMLLYAWDEVPLNAVRGWALDDVDVEAVPTLDSLLASVLIRLMQQRLRIGLGQDYVQDKRGLRGVRGRIDFAQTLKDRTLERGQVVCDYQVYSPNSLNNRIIRSTLAWLMKLGQFGPGPAAAGTLHPSERLRRLIRDLDGIEFIELTPALIQRQLAIHNDRDYHVMLAICELVLLRTMPSGLPGRSIVPAVDRDMLVLHHIYERFVAGFYHFHLKRWEVGAQKRLDWHARNTNQHLPQMVPDLLLRERSSGRIIVLDTKFTAHSLVENPWGKPIFDSAHLYQLYAYLKSQEHLSRAHRSATGILLYPVPRHRISEQIELQDHVIRIESVDLAAPWQEIERQLMEIVTSPATPESTDHRAGGGAG
jgi:5-methylcytosine-specific restriction enzyme subunit McrC